MKVTLLPSYLLFVFLFTGSYSILLAQNQQVLTTANAFSDYAHVLIYYPLEKSATRLSIFLNKKNIGKISNGGRMECQLLLEGPVAVTVIDGNVYKEPLTQSKNSRAISIVKGKSYYFHVSASGVLEYDFMANKGQKHFNDAKDFASTPISFIETFTTSLPSLQTASN